MISACLLGNRNPDILLRKGYVECVCLVAMRYEMEETLFLALGEGLVIEQVVQEPQRFVVAVRSTTPASSCPLCGTLSDFIHSHYQRRLADVPCAGRAIHIQLIVRRFSCRNRVCHRAVFTERLPGLVRPWAQMTQRLREALCKLGFATCAEAAGK
jgi:hypothetical protein